MVMVAHLYNNELSLKIDDWCNEFKKKSYYIPLFFSFTSV